MKKLLFPMFAVVLLTGCVSAEKRKAEELNNKRMVNSIQYPNTSRLKYTLDRGANPNLKDAYGVPVLTRAVAAKRAEHVKMLLNRGADVHAVDNDGETAVFAAVAANDTAILKLLTSKGASINLKNKNGKTPAMEAARLGHIDMLKYLLANGADINAVDNNTAGLAAYAATADKNAIEMLKLLESKGIKVDVENTSLLGSPFLRALFYNRVETALILLPRMQDLNKDSRMKQIGKLAAYYAISHNRIDLLKALISKKLELNYTEPFAYNVIKFIKVDGIYKLAARNDVIDKRYTPLMYACIFGRADMIKVLIESGANPLIENNEGRIAQDYAKDQATTRAITKATNAWKKKYLQTKREQKGLIIKKNKEVKRATIFGF